MSRGRSKGGQPMAALPVSIGRRMGLEAVPCPEGRGSTAGDGGRSKGPAVRPVLQKAFGP